MLAEIMLSFFDAVLTRREGLVNIDGGGVFLHKNDDSMDTRWYMMKCVHGDDVLICKGGG
jgi:hypothetical protein